MTIKFHPWPDDRPASQLRNANKRRLILLGGQIGGQAMLPDGSLDVPQLVDAILPRTVPKFDALFEDWPFDRIAPEVNGYVDLKDGNYAFLRPSLADTVYCDPKSRTEAQKSDLFTVVHETVGHTVSKHREVMIRKYGANPKNKSLRLAHNSKVLKSRKDWVHAYSTADEPVLEEEADVVAFSTLVSVTSIYEELFLPIGVAVPQIAQRCGVAQWVAYNAALLAKDYHRMNYLSVDGASEWQMKQSFS